MPLPLPKDSEEAPNAWTTYDELTPDQRARYGEYVRAKDEARAAGIARQRAGDRAAEALGATGGDKGKALLMLIGGKV